MMVKHKDNNQLLRLLIVVSFLFHIPLYLHMNGLLTTDVLEYIDLSIRKTEDTSGRRMLHPPRILKNRAKADRIKSSLITPERVSVNSKLY
ncbi:MAG: hypothetical protein JXJ04_21220, partial [Spirochaetales bacterium]|nr:hypothetical protein [Spirochaetales bacterium]